MLIMRRDKLEDNIFLAQCGGLDLDAKCRTSSSLTPSPQQGVGRK